MAELLWYCNCGVVDRVEPPYEHGDLEPCVHCEDGTARVVTLREAAEWNQALCLGESWPLSPAARKRVATLRGDESAEVKQLRAVCEEWKSDMDGESEALKQATAEVERLTRELDVERACAKARWNLSDEWRDRVGQAEADLRESRKRERDLAAQAAQLRGSITVAVQFLELEMVGSAKNALKSILSEIDTN